MGVPLIDIKVLEKVIDINRYQSIKFDHSQLANFLIKFLIINQSIPIDCDCPSQTYSLGSFLPPFGSFMEFWNIFNIREKWHCFLFTKRIMLRGIKKVRQ